MPIGKAAARRRSAAGGSGTFRNNGIEKTAHQIATATNDARVALRGVREAERRRGKNPGQVDEEQHAAADVAHHVAGRRDAIGFARRRDMRQQRVVENRGSGDADVADEEQRRRQHDVAFADQHHQRARRHADRHEDRQQPLLDAAVVGKRSEDRRHDRDDRDGDCGDEREPRAGLRRLETLGGVGGEESREDRGDDGGEVDRVGPVVPAPRALLGRDQADAGHQARNHARQDTRSSELRSQNTEHESHDHEDPCSEFRDLSR